MNSYTDPSQNQPQEPEMSGQMSDSGNQNPFQGLFGQQEQDKPKSKLEEYANEINLVQYLDDDELVKISAQVIAGIDEDKTSQRLWMQAVEEAQKLTKLEREPKNTPLPQSANIKFPLITNACYQFASRTYPEIIKDNRVVKGEVLGKDPTGDISNQANRISTHMSYQLLGPNSEFETSMDKLLVVLPNVGFLVKKTYFDALKKRNVSILCNYQDIILRNDKDIQCLDDLRRITHVLYYHLNDLIENSRSGLFSEKAVDKIRAISYGQTNVKACKIYEQHCFLDLDDDGYEEPYIVTVDETTRDVLRIVARYTKDDIEYNQDNKVKRIKTIQCFTDYHFLPAPDGSFMSVGFGTLMLHLNETVNTVLNQLIDAGSLANMQGGFIDARIKIQGGQLYQDPGQWNKVKGLTGISLKDGILPITYKEPSQVLYQLLGLLISTAKELSSSTEVMQGTQNAQNVPATTIMALVEQGMKVFNAIQRRLYRSLKEEYQKLFNLNKRYLDPHEYQLVIGDQFAISQNDYQTANITIIPIADPNLSSDAQRMAKAQYMLNLASQPATNAYLNTPAIIQWILEQADVPHPEMFLKSPQQIQQQQRPNPQAIKAMSDAKVAQQEVQIKARHQDLKEKEFAAELAKIEAQITQMQAHAVKLVADAQSVHKNDQLSELGLQLDTIKSKIQSVSEAHQNMVNNDIAQKEVAVKQQMVNNQTQQVQNQSQVENQSNDQAQENGDSSMDESSNNGSSAQGS